MLDALDIVGVGQFRQFGWEIVEEQPVIALGPVPFQASEPLARRMTLVARCYERDRIPHRALPGIGRTVAPQMGERFEHDGVGQLAIIAGGLPGLRRPRVHTSICPLKVLVNIARCQCGSLSSSAISCTKAAVLDALSALA